MRAIRERPLSPSFSRSEERDSRGESSLQLSWQRDNQDHVNGSDGEGARAREKDATPGNEASHRK